MRWDRLEIRLVADQIQILEPNAAAVMKTAPAASENEIAKKGE